MDIRKIISLFGQYVNCCLRFSFIICIQTTVCALYFHDFHGCTYGNSFQQIYGRDHRTFQLCFLFKGRKSRLCARTPEPAGVCRIQAVLLPFYINRMVYENIITFPHHLTKYSILWKILSDCLPQHIMWLCQFNHFSLIPDQQMAVAGSHIKLVSFILQPFPNCI